jgi:hypothetical protein
VALQLAHIVRFTFSIGLLILLLTACGRHEAKSQNQLVGTWARTGSGAMTLAADGSFRSGWTNRLANPTTDWTYEGTWKVQDGFLICVVTNASSRHATNVAAVGDVERYRIIQLDGTQLITESGGQTNSFERK